MATAVFKSEILKGGDIFTPDVIEISPIEVTWHKRKPNLISKDYKSIPIVRVTNVEVKSHILGADIIVGGLNERITGRNFSKSDAKEMKQMILMLCSGKFK